jgi:hypothetical protein
VSSYVVFIRIGIHTECGGNSVGRVSAFQAECREFESRPPLTIEVSGRFLLNSHTPPCHTHTHTHAHTENAVVAQG